MTSFIIGGGTLAAPVPMRYGAIWKAMHWSCCASMRPTPKPARYPLDGSNQEANDGAVNQRGQLRNCFAIDGKSIDVQGGSSTELKRVEVRSAKVQSVMTVVGLGGPF